MMIRVAIIGAGAISSRHIEGYMKFADDCEICAIVDAYVDKAEKHIAHYELNAAALTDYRALLDDPTIDLVSICTPPSTHAKIAIDCLAAGKHVLVEKPMAASLDECDAMISAAKASGKLLSVVAQNRFQSSWMKLKALLDQKVAGEVLCAQVDSFWWRGHSYYDLWWRGTWESEGGGCTLNHAVHHIDALQWMMGQPAQVHAIMSNVAHDNAEVEDISIALLRFESGAVGQVTSSVVHHGQEQQLVFQCQDAKLSAPWSLYASRSKENGFPERDTVKEAEIQALYDSLPDVAYEGHVGQIDNVLKSIKGESELLIDGYAGRQTLELIVAIYQSASRQVPVALPLSPQDPMYTKAGIMSIAPRFYEKTGSVERFSENEITTRGH